LSESADTVARRTEAFTVPNRLFARVDRDTEFQRWTVADRGAPGLVGEAPTLEAVLTLPQVRVPGMLDENGWAQGDQVPFEPVAPVRWSDFRTVA
jgi:hypothetical protein